MVFFVCFMKIFLHFLFDFLVLGAGFLILLLIFFFVILHGLSQSCLLNRQTILFYYFFCVHLFVGMFLYEGAIRLYIKIKGL